MAESELEALLRQLNRKDIVDWVPEMRLGRPAYDFLLSALRATSLKENHTANVLHALFRLRHHGSPAEIAQVLAERLGEDRRKVRSEAAKLLVGLARLREIDLTADHKAALRSARSLGLLRDVDTLIEAFLSNGDLRDTSSQAGAEVLSAHSPAMARQPSKLEKAMKRLDSLIEMVASRPAEQRIGLVTLLRDAAYQEVARELFRVTEQLAISRRGVEGRLNNILLKVMAAIARGTSAADAAKVGKDAGRELLALLRKEPGPWTIHSRVHNFAHKGLPFTVGNVTLAVADDAYLDEMQRPGHDVIATMRHTDEEKEALKGKLREWVDHEFAQRTMAAVKVEALDGDAAKRVALESLRGKLDLLNYCRSMLPYPVESWVYTDADPMPQLTASLIYRGPIDSPEGFSLPFESIGTLGQMEVEALQGPEASKAGVTQLLALAAKPSLSDVEKKVVTAARLAGAALTRHRRDHAFLLNVVALESLVLGENKDAVDGPLVYRLRLRCARLLGDTVAERRRIFGQVRDIYERRSGIVHRGVSDVTETDVETAEELIRRVLHRIVMTPEALRCSSEEFRSWFEDQLLA